MTPKEKAVELFYKFLKADEIDNYSFVGNEVAKQCALIAVCEILDKDGYNNEYWNEVKQEIEKL
jgi:hypothetical protein